MAPGATPRRGLPTTLGAHGKSASTPEGADRSGGLATVVLEACPSSGDVQTTQQPPAFPGTKGPCGLLSEELREGWVVAHPVSGQFPSHLDVLGAEFLILSDRLRHVQEGIPCQRQGPHEVPEIVCRKPLS